MQRVYKSTQQMISQYMGLHNKGFSNPEIAKICNVDPMTVYRHLGEIAKANGVTRDSLLKVVKKPTESFPMDIVANENVDNEPEVDVDGIVKKMEIKFQAARDVMNGIQDVLNTVVKEENANG